MVARDMLKGRYYQDVDMDFLWQATFIHRGTQFVRDTTTIDVCENKEKLVLKMNDGLDDEIRNS